MNPSRRAVGWAATPVRVRLALALILALAPVLIISALQSALAARQAAIEHEAALAGAADRSAATARASIAAAEILLETLSPGSTGLECASRLAEVRGRIPDYENLIRFDAEGRVACAAAGAPSDPDRRLRPWFAALAAGQPLTVTSQAGARYANQPAILASVRAADPQGRFAGVLTAVIDLSSLRPQTLDPTLPSLSQVAVTDRAGRLLSTTRANAFPADIGSHLAGAGARPATWLGNDPTGHQRVFSSAPLVGDEVFLVLSAPTNGVVSWAIINPVSSIVLPALAFLLA
ncbi:MAG TPA: sensor histidine kinase, partial [Caulobacteraceae bacterium]|nr:sensor histidine kinase [Caulobacteraceae bacterium]